MLLTKLNFVKLATLLFLVSASLPAVAEFSEEMEGLFHNHAVYNLGFEGVPILEIENKTTRNQRFHDLLSKVNDIMGYKNSDAYNPDDVIDKRNEIVKQLPEEKLSNESII